MKILVIGTGQLARFRIAAFQQDPRIRSVAVASSSHDRGATVATEMSADAGGNLDEMLQGGADAIVIASVTSQHAQHIRRALTLGAPILCEKPIAPTIGESRDVVAAADAAGVAIQIGFQRRFDPGLREAHKRLHCGDVGALYSVRLTSHDHRPPPERYIPTRGSVYRDLHVHDFDLARWITGAEIEWIFARGEYRTEFGYLADHHDPDVVAMLLRMTSGVLVSISGAQHDAVGHDVRTEIFGSLDSLATGFNDRIALRPLPAGPASARPGVYQDFLDRFADAFRYETKRFVDFVAGEADNPCPPNAAIEALRAAAAAELSAARGVPVSVTGNPELDGM